MAQSQTRSRLGNTLRFVVLQRVRFALGYGTETARPSTDITQDHEGGGTPRIALGPIWTTSVFADRLQAQFPKQALGKEILVSGRQSAFQPGRQTPRGSFGFNDG